MTALSAAEVLCNDSANSISIDLLLCRAPSLSSRPQVGVPVLWWFAVLNFKWQRIHMPIAAVLVGHHPCLMPSQGSKALGCSCQIFSHVHVYSKPRYLPWERYRFLMLCVKFLCPLHVFTVVKSRVPFGGEIRFAAPAHRQLWPVSITLMITIPMTSIFT